MKCQSEKWNGSQNHYNNIIYYSIDFQGYVLVVSEEKKKIIYVSPPYCRILFFSIYLWKIWNHLQQNHMRSHHAKLILNAMKTHLYTAYALNKRGCIFLEFLTLALVLEIRGSSGGTECDQWCINMEYHQRFIIPPEIYCALIWIVINYF